MDALVLHFDNINANDKARDIFNLAYEDTEDNRKNFEVEIKKADDEGNYLLMAALRAQFVSTYRIASSVTPQD